MKGPLQLSKLKARLECVILRQKGGAIRASEKSRTVSRSFPDWQAAFAIPGGDDMKIPWSAVLWVELGIHVGTTLLCREAWLEVVSHVLTTVGCHFWRESRMGGSDERKRVPP